MSNNKDTNKIEPKFNEAQAYEELRMIFVIAIETQNFNGIEEKIAAWENKYPLADFTNPEIVRKIKAILNKDFLSRLMGDYLAAKVLHEKEKQKQLYDDLKNIIDSARKSKDYKSAQRQIYTWKSKLNSEGISLYDFDRFYKAKVCTLLLVPSKELKNQEEAMSSLKEIKEKSTSFSSEDYSKAIIDWQNKYSLESFPEKLKTELNEITSEALNSIQEKKNEENAVSEVRELVATNLNGMPLDAISIVLAKYDYAHFSDMAKSQIEDLSQKAVCLSEQALEDVVSLPQEDELLVSKRSTSALQFNALDSLKVVLEQSSYDTSAILNWIYENRKINFSQFAREEIIKQFTSAGYKIPQKGEFSIPILNSQIAPSQLEEARKNAILNYLGIISQGNSLSKKGKDNISQIQETSQKETKKPKAAIVLPVFDTIPSMENEPTPTENSVKIEVSPAESDIYNIFSEDLIADPLITYDISPAVSESLETEVAGEDAEKSAKVEIEQPVSPSDKESLEEKSNNTDNIEPQKTDLTNENSLGNDADEEIESPKVTIPKENIDVEPKQVETSEPEEETKVTIKPVPKYSLTSQDQENIEELHNQTIYIAVAYPILEEAFAYKAPKIPKREKLEDDTQKNNGF